MGASDYSIEEVLIWVVWRSVLKVFGVLFAAIPLVTVRPELCVVSSGIPLPMSGFLTLQSLEREVVPSSLMMSAALVMSGP